MITLLTALLLSQTYPVLTGQNLTMSNTPSAASLSVIGAGTVYVYYSHAGTAAGNLTLTAQAFDTNGHGFGPIQTQTINPTTGLVALILSAFTGVGVMVTWSLSGPNDFFNGVTISVQTQPITDGGGGGSIINGDAGITGNLHVTGSIYVGSNKPSWKPNSAAFSRSVETEKRERGRKAEAEGGRMKGEGGGIRLIASPRMRTMLASALPLPP